MMEVDDKMPVIADVFTNLDARETLEEGVGMPMVLYLRVSIEGTPTVCVGAVYSYYEFRHPIKDRLTDEAWRKMVDNAKPPAMPKWTSEYVVSSPR